MSNQLLESSWTSTAHPYSSRGAAFNAFRPQGQRAADTPEVCEHTKRDAPQHQARVAQTGAAFNAFRPQGKIYLPYQQPYQIAYTRTPVMSPKRDATWRWCDHRAASITTLMLGQIPPVALVRSPSCLYLIHGARDTHRAAHLEHARVRRT